MGFLSSLFKKSKAQDTQEETAESVSKIQEEGDFDILKYDGIRAARIGRLPYAILCFKKALEIKEDDEILVNLAQIYVQRGELQEAEEPMKRMCDLHPGIAEMHLSLSNLYYMMEDYEKMLSMADKAVAIDPGNTLAYLYKGRASYASNDLKSAAASLDQALAMEPTFTDARLLRAQIHYMEKEYEQALALLDAIIDSEDDDEGALLLKAQILEATGGKDQAEEIYRSLIKDNPFQMASYISLSILYLNDGREEEAEKILSDALEMKPDYVDAIRSRLAIRRARHDEEGILEDERALEEAMKEAPEIPDYVIKGQKETDVLGL